MSRPAGRGFTVRTFRTGDLGLLASRQSVLYAQSQGWGRGLELVELEVVHAFLRDFKPAREQCWIAEVDGVMAGSVLLTDEGGGLSKLRLLYVEPFARGRGIGGELVDGCVRFARSARYERMTLWTHRVLASARRIYEAHGFRIVGTETHDRFGPVICSETWELEL